MNNKVEKYLSSFRCRGNARIFRRHSIAFDTHGVCPFLVRNPRRPPASMLTVHKITEFIYMCQAYALHYCQPIVLWHNHAAIEQKAKSAQRNDEHPRQSWSSVATTTSKVACEQRNRHFPV